MAGFYKALKLVAVAQAGQPVAPGLLGMKTALPAFEGVPSDVGIVSAPPTPGLSRSNTGFSTAPAPAESVALNVSKEERQRWMNAFQQAGPHNGVVGAVAARDFFLRSGLPAESLSKIWFVVVSRTDGREFLTTSLWPRRTLADTRSRGSLDVNDFLIAMFLISRVKSGTLASVPQSLPPNVIATITGQGPATPVAAPSPVPSSPMPAAELFSDWGIGAKEKEAYDRVFEKTDVGGKGYLSSEFLVLVAWCFARVLIPFSSLLASRGSVCFFQTVELAVERAFKHLVC
jgi:epidermal growth factor receptor substrate 15